METPITLLVMVVLLLMLLLMLLLEQVLLVPCRLSLVLAAAILLAGLRHGRC
jgi:hypothetical protein